MTSISTDISTARRSRINGYQLNKGNFNTTTPNLPQIVVMLGEGNHANQGTISTDALQVTSAAQVGATYGYGSPLHQMARILMPLSGQGLGGIPIIVMAQAEAEGATVSTLVWTITGTATANSSISILVNGRDNIDGVFYNVAIAIGDTPTVIAGKIKNVINAVLSCPVTAANTAGVITFSTKWFGATSADVNISVRINDVTGGVTYAQTAATPGSGTPDISAATSQFEENWYTTVINPYGSAMFAALEAFNGVPDNQNPTGRYSGESFYPFMAFFGMRESTVGDISAITDADARVSQVTNVSCPAPGSDGMDWEAAANMVALFCPVMQNTPELDVNGLTYPDMPTPLTIGDMALYTNRDALLKLGSSTVSLKNGAYMVQDLVTTYHPDGEDPLQFNYCRGLNLDWNIKDGYTILYNKYVQDKVIVADNQVTSSANAIKPKEWKGIVFDYLDNEAIAALISNPQFSKNTMVVQVDPTNPQRIDTTFNYIRTGIARIGSTTATASY